MRLLEKTRQSLEEPEPGLSLAAMRGEILVTAGRGMDELPALEDLLAGSRLPAPGRAEALAMAGLGYAYAGRRTDALARLDDEMRMIDQWRHEAPPEEPRCCLIRHVTHLLAGELDAAEAAVADLHRLGRRTGTGTSPSVCSACRWPRPLDFVAESARPSAGTVRPS